MSAKTQHAAERFPDLAQAIKQYASDNRFFRGLCEDYGEAVEILRRWEGLDDSVTPERIGACRELVADLEREILIELRVWNEGERPLGGPDGR